MIKIDMELFNFPSVRYLLIISAITIHKGNLQDSCFKEENLGENCLDHSFKDNLYINPEDNLNDNTQYDTREESRQQICPNENKRETKSTNGDPNGPRYIFYEVKDPEGFNLRRDVYLRMAVFAHKLSRSPNPSLSNFKLVLPPWSHMYHWERADEAERYPWSKFFQVESLKKFAPVIEMHEFFATLPPTYSKVRIDEVYVLHQALDVFETGDFSDRFEEVKCEKRPKSNFFFYGNLTANSFKCISAHGSTSLLQKVLEKSGAKTFLFVNAETLLHDMFGNALYWKARRSMRFNEELKTIAGDFRRKFLDSSDEKDSTALPEDWRDEKYRRTAVGGPYLAAHLRRRDFVWSSHKTPSLEKAAGEIIKLLEELRLRVAFVATDAPDKEIDELRSYIPDKFTLFTYRPNRSVKKRYGDGGVAIIEQIICSHGRYFIGTQPSTFTFRIQEEREILGFPVETTFNAFCADENCERGSVWKIVY